MEKLTKRKNARSKGNAQLKPKRRNDEVAYILTDVKETVVTENFYQPIPVSILKYFMPNGMM